MAKTVACIECGGEVPLSAKLIKGEILSCPDCGAELEVISTNPIKIELAPEVDEDWGE